MAKSDKKISINVMDKIMKEHFENVATAQWMGIDVKIKRSISFTEMMEFVNDVVMSCFQENGGYIPEVLDFAIKSNILTKYANFSMPDNLEHRYEIIYNTSAVDFVCGQINMAQLQEIVGSINRKVEYMCNGNVMTIQRKMNEFIDAIEGFQSQATNMFANLTPDDLAKVVSAFGANGISEDKIVEAYMNRVMPDNGAVEAEA